MAENVTLLMFFTIFIKLSFHIPIILLLVSKSKMETVFLDITA